MGNANLTKLLRAAWFVDPPEKSDDIIALVRGVYHELGGMNRKVMRDTVAFLEAREVEKASELVDIATRDWNADRANDAARWGPEDNHVILTPMRFSDMIDHLKTKPQAIETSYQLPTKADPHNKLRFPTGAFSIIAGATGHCKTTFLINLLLDAAELYPTKSHWFFSFEENGAAIMLKAANAFARTRLSCGNRRSLETYYRIDDPQYMDPDGFQEYLKREQKFRGLVDPGTINIVSCDWPAEELFQRIRELEEEATGLVLLDYIGLVQLASREYSMTRAEELKHIALRLKDLAIQTGLAIVAGAQFNRTVQSPGRMAPWAIAEASDIERAANTVVGLWKGGAQANPEPGEKIPGQLTDGRLYLRVLKARDEESGTAAIYPFDGNLGTVGLIPFPQTTVSGHSGEISKEDLY